VYKSALGDGTGLSASHVIWAISKKPCPQPPTPLSPVGDLVSWSRIKRCGAAMAMGHNAAFNIHQQLLEAQTGKKAELIEFLEVPPMIALAVGKKAISYSPNAGTEEGAEVMRNFFGDDLGLKSKWS
jgi:hypothetical protein